jgi:hypothetical protein
VFHYVEQAHGPQSLRQHSSIVERRSDDLAYAAIHSISHAGKSRFNEHDIKSGLLNRARHATISATYIEKGSGRRKEPDRFENTPISVFKPEGRVLHQKTERVSILGVRHFG